MDRLCGLNTFIAVVEAGAFSAAARATGNSRSGISKAIASLEKHLDVILLNRGTRRVTLMDQGQRCYGRTKPHKSRFGSG